MKPEDKEKLNECLKILGTTGLGLPMEWLWTWSTITNILDDESYNANVTKDQMWDHLCEAAEAGQWFSLGHGAEQHHEEVQDWMLKREYIVDTMFEREDEDEDE